MAFNIPRQYRGTTMRERVAFDLESLRLKRHDAAIRELYPVPLDNRIHVEYTIKDAEVSSSFQRLLDTYLRTR